MRWLALPLLLLLAGDVAAGDSFNPKQFDELVAPFVKKHCVRCHNGEEAEGGLDLSVFQKADDLLAQRKPWQRVVRQLKAGAMPPEGYPRPNETQLKAVIAWLEQALVYVDASKPVDPGRVTVRRLNRTEYNHTLRDLFGVALPLAIDFPADDLGYGFDNIGDVLSISPLRMEQYLNAAEKLTSALLLKSDKPIYDEFSEAVFFKWTKSRPLNSSDRGWEIIPENETYLEFEFPLPGEYELRLYAWGVEKPTEKERPLNERWLETDALFKLDPNAKPPVEATILCDDRVLGHLPVLPGNSTVAFQKPYKLRFTTQAGFHMIRIQHRFPREMSEAEKAAHLKKPLLAPRLGVRRVAISGPNRFAEAKLTVSHQALLNLTSIGDKRPLEAARESLRIIASQAWRRPVSRDELEQLTQFVGKQLDRGRSLLDAVELAVHVILVSPRFLYRLEPLPPGSKPGVAVPVQDYALASRLSYFLWSSMPDQELFRLAEANKLSDPKVLAGQVDRMLRDRRSEAFVEGFFGQWLGVRKLPDLRFDSKMFPEFSSELRDDLRRETELFVGSIVRENRSVLDLLRADYTYLNGRLAGFYGVKGIEKSADFRKVSLSGTPRQGILTHGSILMLPSYPNRTSPTRRGNWVLETILGEEPPPPPDNVPELAQTQAAQPNLPLRKQLELHRTNAVCASCHRTMDAIGFGLENFDAIGRWRDKDRGQPIDAAGELPSGDKFSSPKELIQILTKRQDDFARNLVGRMLTYALGRGLEPYDRLAIDTILERTRADEYRFQDLIREVVLSRPFRWQRPDLEETKR
jgi:mono/diheme cytochrome c family protein